MIRPPADKPIWPGFCAAHAHDPAAVFHRTQPFAMTRLPWADAPARSRFNRINWFAVWDALVLATCFGGVAFLAWKGLL